jgi:hypothetical protein
VRTIVDISAADSIPMWRKSSYSSAQGNCVEVAVLPRGGTAVRDSRQPAGPILAFNCLAWKGFCHAIKAGSLTIASKGTVSSADSGSRQSGPIASALPTRQGGRIRLS